MEGYAEGSVIQPVPQRVTDILKETKPWVKFLAIFGFALAGLMVLLALVVLIASPFMEGGLGVGVLMSFVYLISAVLYVIPCLSLYRYGSSIDRLVHGGGQAAMEEALDHQRRFWRVAGILTIVMLCLYAVVFVGAIVVFAILGLRG
ncbi:MAG: DUF5362 family protein [Candidatus Polarisedimenticolia bacterium]